MTESTYAIPSGESVHRHHDDDGTLVEQTCIRCHEWRPARKFPRRADYPTGRGLKCYVCKRRQWAANRRVAYLAAHPDAAA